MKKVINYSDRICLFCGKPEKKYWDDCDEYWECDCKDAVETRKIKNQIDELKRKLPHHKYEIVTEQVLRKL